ncbi:hypothetical protein [Pseudonocardia spinosispora]|uniref:hypothetical protein n=1 Tax=Pseudonocardia spinosispora TaxID=103441 RepID=UPI0003F8C234|nr:hypothetical protein [Pseudonocardia spinosispora]
MFKKAGIVVAAATAGMLALSPLAFAGDYDGDSGDHGHSRHHGGHDRDRDRDGDRVNAQSGLVNLQNVGVQAPVQLCNNSILGGVLGILSSGQSNSDRHDGKCGQSNSSDD